MITVRNILDLIETFAPLNTAEDWDNVGLLVGRHDKQVKRVMVALDPFYHVVQEASEWGADLLLVHHPLFFSTKTVTDRDDIGRTILALLKADMAEISLHTNLDQAQGGVNDCLAEACGLQNIDFLEVNGVDKNGNAHGYCRVGEVEPCSLEDYALRVKEGLGCQGVRVASAGREVHKVCVGSGSCAAYAAVAAAAGCDTFVTGDEKYNNFHDAQALGINVIDAGHFYTENVVCPYLKRKLEEAFPELEVKISETHRDLIRFY
ncbi:MAG: Nif3-like dinuclear metal center hexameric protein [Ruminococcaceae bacterium]|nr:Nif3-like dinuclear metal center hexameric protein [Oscillospiraceae bacterium]